MIVVVHSGNTFTVLQVNDSGSVTLDSTVLASSALLRDVRFDTTPGAAFGGFLYYSVSGLATAPLATTLFEVPAAGGGGLVNVATFPNSGSDATCLRYDFSQGEAGYAADTIYMTDVCKPTSFWTCPTTFVGAKISANLLPPGRTDMDVGGIEFDRGGAFGGLLYLADSDTNCDKISAVYILYPDFTWGVFVPAESTNSVRYSDMAISTGGALGERMYLAAATPISPEIRVVEPSGATSVFASGFPTSVRSISVAEDGSTLFVADTTTVYAIRASLSGAPATISLSSGGSHTLTMNAPAQPSGIYHVLGSVSGTSPGIDFGGGVLLSGQPMVASPRS